MTTLAQVLQTWQTRVNEQRTANNALVTALDVAASRTATQLRAVNAAMLNARSKWVRSREMIELLIRHGVTQDSHERAETLRREANRQMGRLMACHDQARAIGATSSTYGYQAALWGAALFEEYTTSFSVVETVTLTGDGYGAERIIPSGYVIDERIIEDSGNIVNRDDPGREKIRPRATWTTFEMIAVAGLVVGGVAAVILIGGRR